MILVDGTILAARENGGLRNIAYENLLNQENKK